MLINGKDFNLDKAYINLSRSHITNDILKLIAKELEGNNIVTKLDLSANNITEQGAKHIVQILQNNKNITHLNLANNRIRSDGINEIAGALATNTTVTHFNISNNSITGRGIISLTQIFNNNKTIKRLNLQENNIDKNFKAQKALANIAIENKSLMILMPNLVNEYFRINDDLSCSIIHVINLGFQKDDIAIKAAKRLKTAVELNQNIIYFNGNEISNYKKIENIIEKLKIGQFDDLPYDFLKVLAQNEEAVKYILIYRHKTPGVKAEELIEKARNSSLNSKWVKLICKEEEFNTKSPLPKDILSYVSGFFGKDYISFSSNSRVNNNFLQHILLDNLDDRALVQYIKHNENILSVKTLKSAKAYINLNRDKQTKSLIKTLIKDNDSHKGKCITM
ncbi:MAG: hypothetical protein ACK4OM_00840 [Alphaproteobacteria bacterium]